jgi:hypothetical protein
LCLGSRLVVFAIAAALLIAPLTGCNVSKVRVRLPAFGTGNVDGLWFWRLEGSSYKRICRFDLSHAYFSGGREVVDYSQSCLDGRQGAPWQAVVERLPTNPQTVTLELQYRRSGAATSHRATTFNQRGESALSTAALSL